MQIHRKAIATDLDTMNKDFQTNGLHREHFGANVPFWALFFWMPFKLFITVTQILHTQLVYRQCVMLDRPLRTMASLFCQNDSF